MSGNNFDVRALRERILGLESELSTEKVLADAAAGACVDYLDRIEALEKDNEIYRLANRLLTQRDGSHVARAISLEATLSEAERIGKNHAGIADTLRTRIEELEDYAKEGHKLVASLLRKAGGRVDMKHTDMVDSPVTSYFNSVHNCMVYRLDSITPAAGAVKL